MEFAPVPMPVTADALLNLSIHALKGELERYAQTKSGAKKALVARLLPGLVADQHHWAYLKDGANFWSVEVRHCTTCVSYGRQGATGRQQASRQTSAFVKPHFQTPNPFSSIMHQLVRELHAVQKSRHG